MVKHVGADPKRSLIAVYDTITSSIVEHVIDRVPNENEDKINNFFLAIKEAINSALECFCVLLDGYVKNDTRIKYLQAAKIHGFSKAEIISIGKAELIEMIKNVSNETLNETDGNFMIFHIFENWITCAIWKKHKNGGFTFECVERHRKINDKSALDDIKILKERLQKLYSISQVGFYDYKKVLEENQLKLIFSEVNDVYFCKPKQWMNSTLLYACYLSGNIEYSKYKANEILEKNITIKINEIVIISISQFTPLPLKMEKLIKTVVLKAKKEIVFDIYDFDELVESYILYSAPENFKIIFEIDNNTISQFSAVNDTNELKLIQQNISDLSFRIPGKAIYFNPTLNGVGIDFGTVKCCAAVNRKSRIDKVVLDNNASRMLPTFVSFDEKHEKCGQLVIDRMAQSSQYTVFDIKRILGYKFNEINIDTMWPFKLQNINDEIFIDVETVDGRKLYKPEEIASMFFKHIKTKIDEYQGKQLTEAVITIPASYNKSQKEVLISAAKLGGWKIVYLLPEPIAAAFVYCDEAALEINFNLLIFDLGGGTLDIFIVKTATCMLNVLSSNGSLVLGGRDFDTVLINYFDKALKEIYGIHVMENDSKKYKFLADCQKIKCDLSNQNEAWLDVENYDCTNENIIQITRDKFEKLSLHLLQQIEQITQETVDKAEMNNEQIDVVLYVGGGCRMPMIKRLLAQMFPKSKHCCAAQPDEMVAEGAALYACLLKCKYP